MDYQDLLEKTSNKLLKEAALPALSPKLLGAGLVAALASGAIPGYYAGKKAQGELNKVRAAGLFGGGLAAGAVAPTLIRGISEKLGPGRDLNFTYI